MALCTSIKMNSEIFLLNPINFFYENYEQSIYLIFAKKTVYNGELKLFLYQYTFCVSWNLFLWLCGLYKSVDYVENKNISSLLAHTMTKASLF